MTPPMSALRLLLLATGLFLLGCPRPLPSQLSPSPLVNVLPANDPSTKLAALPSSLVHVRTFCQRSDSQPDSTASAFVVGHADGWAYLVSARHVLFPDVCGKQLAARVQLRGEGVRDFDGDAQPLIQLQTRPEDDLILLRARGDKRTPAVEIGVLNTAMLGNDADPIEAFGFSTVQGNGALPLHEKKSGSVSKSLREDTGVLTTNAKLLPSMSGGPVALRSSGLVFGVVLGEYEAQKGGSREGRIATLAPLIDLLPEALRQQLGIVLHYSVSAAYQPDKPKSTWVGRPEQAKVLSLLDGAKPGMESARVLLHGIGGVGKTTLAYQVAALRQSRFPGGIVKIELTDRPSDVVLDELLEAMTGHKVPSGDRFKLLRALLSNRPPVLVILDNVRLDGGPWSDPATMDALLQALSPATLLMTSRSPKAPENFVAVPVASLPEQPATELVLKLSRYQGLVMGDSDAAELARLLGGLPFALKRAIELMQSEHYSVRSLLLKLRQEGRDPDGRLAKLLDWSYEALDTDAKAVLVAMGQLAEAPVPEVLLAGLLPQTNRTRGIQRLIRSGLLERSSPGATTYHMHTLILEWAGRLGLSKHGKEVGLLKQNIHNVLRSHDSAMVPLFLSHIMTAQRQAESAKQFQQVISIVSKFDDALESYGYWETRKNMLDRAILAARALAEKLTMSELVRRRGVLATFQSDYIHARKLLDEALGVIPDIQDAQTLERKSDVTCAIGVLCMMQDDFSDAEENFQDCLSIRKRLDIKPLIANVLMSFGNLSLRKKELNAAMQYYERSLQIHKNSNNAIGIAGVLVNQGRLLLSKRSPDQAKLHFVEAVSILKEIGRLHELGKALLGLADAEKMLGRRTEALIAYKQSVSIFDIIGDLDSVQKTKQLISEAKEPIPIEEPHSVGASGDGGDGGDGGGGGGGGGCPPDIIIEIEPLRR